MLGLSGFEKGKERIAVKTSPNREKSVLILNFITTPSPSFAHIEILI